MEIFSLNKANNQKMTQVTTMYMVEKKDEYVYHKLING